MSAKSKKIIVRSMVGIGLILWLLGIITRIEEITTISWVVIISYVYVNTPRSSSASFRTEAFTALLLGGYLIPVVSKALKGGYDLNYCIPASLFFLFLLIPKYRGILSTEVTENPEG